jgi:archaellum component FlaC
LSTKLNNIIRYEEDLVTNVENLLYRATDDAEKLIKVLQDADMQLAECMTQIRDMAAEKELKHKELKQLKGAVQVVIYMVDPLEEGVINKRTLLERLCEAPQKISGYISETTKTYVAHILVLVKSYWPKANLNPLVDGMYADCFEETFLEYIKEVKLVA